MRIFIHDQWSFPTVVFQLGKTKIIIHIGCLMFDSICIYSFSICVYDNLSLLILVQLTLMITFYIKTIGGKLVNICLVKNFKDRLRNIYKFFIEIGLFKHLLFELYIIKYKIMFSWSWITLAHRANY